MSDESPSIYINSSKFFHPKQEQNKKLLSFSDISPLNQSWDKHRANADIVAEYYAFGEKG